MSRRAIGWIGFMLSIIACNTKQSINRFSDPVLVRIAEFQDRRLTDSLLVFFKSPVALYRGEAALAFASIQDSAASQALANLLLEDTTSLVRIRAAYALGQTGGVAAVNGLIPAIQDKDLRVSRFALEGLGKCIKRPDIVILDEFKTTDTLLQQGLAWAYYRMGLRGITDSVIVEKQVGFLSSPSVTVRMAAAFFFDRTAIKGTKFKEKISEIIFQDPSALVRMSGVSSLRKLNVEYTLPLVMKVLTSEIDYRVRVNAIRALRTYPFDKIKDLIRIGLSDSSEQVNIAASEIAKTTGAGDDFLPLARECKIARVQANLYQAVLMITKDTAQVTKEIKSLYQRSTNPYQRSFLAGALSKNIFSYPFLFNELIRSQPKVIWTAAAQALTDINYSKAFPIKWKPIFANLYRKAIEAGDPGVIGTIAGALADSTLGYKSLYPNVLFLDSAKKNLHLPKDAEILEPLEHAIAYLAGRPKPTPAEMPFNHPLQWSLIRAIRSDQKAEVMTSKGTFVMQLKVDEAPGSVANFVELTQRKYYDGKFVHRVVPNFVLQTGCNRGDGFGSEDYSIRSEFSMRSYKTGSVGYASAGKDTEGTQWFVTYSPTPHLDGRYSIFAEVIKGMDVADQVAVGDTILSVRLIP